MQSNSHGFTLIELMLTMAIAAIILTTAVPSMSTMITSARVAGASDRVKSEIEWARTEAVKDNQSVSIFFNTGANWCMGIDDNSDGDNVCDCASTTCQVNGEQKVLSYHDYKNTSLTVDISDNNFSINSRGLAKDQGNGEITLTDGEHTATINLSALGRARICSDNMSKFPAC